MTQRVDRHREIEARYWQAERVAPTEQWVTLASTGTRVRVQEVGDGEPVVFVHGGSTSGTGWAPLAARLAGFRCLLLDRPGCGLSEPLPEPKRTMETFVPFADALVAEVLDGLQIDHAPVVATSFGSYFSLRAAAAHPERIERLVLLAFPVGASARHTPASMRMAGVPGVGALMSRMRVSKRIARTMLGQLGLAPALAAGRAPEVGVDWFCSVLNDTDTMVNELRTMPPVLGGGRGLSTSLELDEALLARVEAPTLLRWAADDPFGGGDVARAFARHLPNAELQVIGAGGHVPWLDQPDRTATAVAEFLSR